MSKPALGSATPTVVGRIRPPATSRGGEPMLAGPVALPVRTRLVRSGEDLPALVAAATAGIARPGDVVCISETAVAIAQGRLIAAETIRPSRLARTLARRAGALATINQPESMQLVIDQVGGPRVLGAAILHAAALLVLRRRGVFYRLLGEAIATIDGYTGTLPPFERTIVLGPQDPDGAARAIAAACGAEVAIVDANDLGIAKVLGASPAVDRRGTEIALRANPHGNGDEQTPIVVLKTRPPAAASADGAPAAVTP